MRCQVLFSHQEATVEIYSMCTKIHIFSSHFAVLLLSMQPFCPLMVCTPSVPKYMSFKIFQYELHTDVYRRILKCRFTHCALYVVHIEISKETYI